MRVLFLTLSYPEQGSGSNIYSDLMQEFHERGDEVYVICQRERRTGLPTEFQQEQGIHVLRVRTGNVTKTNKIEKGIATLRLEHQFIQAIKKYLSQVKFDLVLYSTPPITFENAVKYIQQRDRCKTYLLLKDIFPQNAVDIGMLKENGLLWRYFRQKEKRLYELSDVIGCMSPGNMEYILRHNPQIQAEKVEQCPNSIKPGPLVYVDAERHEIRERYGIPDEAVTFVYGGNLGLPQGIDFLLEALKQFKDRRDLFFIIVGSGTEYMRIHNFLQEGQFQNARLIKSLPKDAYDPILRSSDVGLILLDSRFTIPNIPSRLTSYMESALPVACATDRHTDLKEIVADADCGKWVESNDIQAFVQMIDELAADPVRRREMGMNGRMYLEMHYTVSRAYDIISTHI